MDRHAVAAIATLDDDVRRSLYGAVREAGQPLTREAAADAVGISRKLAAFHLDKLVAAGLLQSHIEPAAEPRVGRAPKVYELSGCDIGVQVPQRDHTLLAEIVLAAAGDADGGEDTAPVREAVLRAAGHRGERDGIDLRAEAGREANGRLGVERAMRLTRRLLAEHGFEPAPDGECVRLRNCPFHPLVQASPQVVCSLNHAYLAGVLRGLGADRVLDARLEPGPGRCCVAFHPHRTSA